MLDHSLFHIKLGSTYNFAGSKPKVIICVNAKNFGTNILLQSQSIGETETLIQFHSVFTNE